MSLFIDSSLAVISRDVRERMNVLVASDLLLTFFIGHSSDVLEIDELLEHLDQRNIHVYVTDFCLERVSYYLSAPPPNSQQKAIISWFKRRKVAAQLKSLFQAQRLDVTYDMVQAARQLSVQDFDTAVEIICAKTHHLDALITHEQVQQFEDKSLDLKIWSLKQLLTRFGLARLLAKPD